MLHKASGTRKNIPLVHSKQPRPHPVSGAAVARLLVGGGGKADNGAQVAVASSGDWP